ncbi:clr6 L associated factor 1 Laf1 [Schizosaccharomyces japonicus yFS275]|uniref:Clr6 L associated factor 1 Laf1 n=1 Tax=Schizosaccharomyces japonicus (strain yFS275 / FY16936) TaxID=402676 RepID=B6K488_SCHJY|nr:clr6 L associated factor 1 Laf1 [Schizosaccharomyces japonicus yFS275]EEB08295.2 clr6 L associated factor 1 Laf1 [Schizosaccharomyces japonicus yFS275]
MDATEKIPAASSKQGTKDVCSSTMKSYQFLISPPPSPLTGKNVKVSIECGTVVPAEKSVTSEESVEKKELEAQLTSLVIRKYRKNPLSWLSQEREWLQHHSSFRRDRFCRRRTAASAIDGLLMKDRAAGGNGRGGRYSRSGIPTAGAVGHRLKQSSREFSTNAHVFDVANTPYELLPDYSPDMSVLDKRTHPRPLRTEWKGPPLDLSNDEHSHLLHPAELQLASTLRLPCLVYLDNKRRIFAEWHNRHSQGLTFRKTDAQRASRVDVNKASRLWKAFHDEGFFDD